MMAPLRDPRAAPLEPRRQTSFTSGYVRDIDRLGAESSALRGNVDGIAAIRQAIWHIVNTEWRAFRNTPPGGGITMEAITVNRSPNYFRARVERVVRNALIQDDRIIDVKLLRTQKTGPRSVAAWFKVLTVFGTFEEGFSVPLSGGPVAQIMA